MPHFEDIAGYLVYAKRTRKLNLQDVPQLIEEPPLWLANEQQHPPQPPPPATNENEAAQSTDVSESDETCEPTQPANVLDVPKPSIEPSVEYGLSTPSILSQRPRTPRTPVYQRYTRALQNDPRAAQEVALGRRIGLYKFCGDIGRGNFSRVKLAVNQLTKDKVAIKVVDTSRLDAKALRMLSREVSTLECVYHPFILRLFEVIETLGKIHLISEWIQGGELYNRIIDVGPLKETHASSLFYQILLAVKHLHSLGFVHRDIKAENVLMVDEERIKLADFGFSTQLVNGPWQHLDTFCGSPPYAAPELFSDDHYIGAPVDIWALGVLLYFMLDGNMPFKAPTVPLLRNAVLKGDFTISSSLSLPCSRLIQRILVHVPSRRPSINQLLECQWFEYAQTLKRQEEKTPKVSTDNSTKQSNTTLQVPRPRKNFFWFLSHLPGNHSTEQETSSQNNEVNDEAEEDATPKILPCNTKRSNSILNDTFLNPLKFETENGSMHKEEDLNASRPRPKIFFLRVKWKKKIVPLETASIRSSKEKIFFTRTNILQEKCQQKIDEEHKKFVMYPTDLITANGEPDVEGDVNAEEVIHLNDHINPIEIESRRILSTYGITAQMIHDAVPSGPRSDIIGVYRIIVHRLQKEQAFRRQPEQENNLKEPKVSNTGSHSSTCAIL